MFPEESFTPVVTRILYVVESERLSDEDTVNVLSELDTVGEEDICTQVLKLSEETCSDPEHVVLDVLVVTVVVSIASLKVTAIVELTETEVAESAGEDEETVGAVVSVVVVLSVVPVAEYSSLSSVQEMMVRLKQEIRIMNKTFFIELQYVLGT